MALNEYVPSSKLLAGGRIYASRGLVRSFESDGGFGLVKFRFECTEGHIFYEAHDRATQCRICSSPLRSNRGKDALIPRFGYSCAAWDPPSWSGDPERVGLAELTSTVDFVNRLGLQEFAALGGVEVLNARFCEGGTIFAANSGMLLTGFDAPVEQVMYLDKVIVAHGLLQAIARVNRVAGAAKEKGFVVDYVGVGHHLKKALDTYDEREQKEMLDTLSFPEEELRALKASRDAIMEFLNKNGLTDLTDHDAFFDLFYDEDLRFEFMTLFQAYTRCLNVVFPAKEALGFMPEYEALAEINVLAGKHFRDARLSMRGIPPKLRKIADTFLESRGIQIKVEPISILDEDFQKDVGNRTRTKTKAAEIEHAIRHHLDVELNDDPDLRASFAEALRLILAEFQDNWNKVYEELEKLRLRIINAAKEPTYGLHRKKQMPFFRMLKREIYGEAKLEEDAISALVSLTQQVFGEVERELKLTGFWESIPARNKLRADIQRTLLQAEFSKLPGIVQNRTHMVSRIMEIAEKNDDSILYAA